MCVSGGGGGALWLSAPLQLKVDTSVTLIPKAKEYLWRRRVETLNYRRSVDALVMM